jgi:uncharacterized protein (DUF1015 family)
MVTLVPFRARRPAAALAARVASPPYDVVTTEEARALARGNADSFLRVSRPEVDLPQGIDERTDAVHAKGCDNLAELVRRGVLVQDPEPRFYVYAQRLGEHRQTGLAACATLDEYDTGVIREHEKTSDEKVDDRFRHIDALSAHDEPLFLTYRAVPAIDRLIEEVKRSPPTYDLLTHRLWAVPRDTGAAIAALFRSVPALYIADGHHRCAAASRVHARRRGQPGEHGVFLTVVIPHDQVQILAYNRLVRDPAGRRPEALLAALREIFEVEPAVSGRPTEPHTCGVFVGGRWWRARVRPGSYHTGDPVSSLDCTIVQDQLLAPVFGIADQRTSKDVAFVGGSRGPPELERRVRQERWSLALHLFPTRLEQLFAVSDTGKLMPPKSTWFEPKLRSGLFMHPF